MTLCLWLAALAFTFLVGAGVGYYTASKDSEND